MCHTSHTTHCLGPWANSGNWMMFPQASCSCEAEVKRKWQPCSQGIQQVCSTWQSRLTATNYVEECSFTEPWEPKTIFYLHLGDQESPQTCWNPPFHWTRSFPDESSQAIVPSFKPICNVHVPTRALTTLSLLCGSSQLSVTFSSAALTSKNENNTKKLCNAKGEGLNFLYFWDK